MPPYSDAFVKQSLLHKGSRFPGGNGQPTVVAKGGLRHKWVAKKKDVYHREPDGKISNRNFRKI